MSNSADPQSRTLLRRAGWLLGLALLALIACTSVVFVDESEFVLVETLGRIVAVYDRADPKDGARNDARNNDRGLHFKLPWPVAMVRRFDRRQQLFDPPGREMFTRDKKNITVSSYLCWKIADPADPNTPLAIVRSCGSSVGWEMSTRPRPGSKPACDLPSKSSSARSN